MNHNRTSAHILPSQVSIEPVTSGARSWLPHPLDFDWRFTEATTSTLWRLARELAHPKEGIVLLGVPSMASRAAESPVWDGEILLLDKNAPRDSQSTTSLEMREFDVLRDPVPEFNTALIFADPPWYEAESVGFLWSASALCRPGGYVVMSIPPIQMRPGILEERERIDRTADTFGLRLLDIVPSAIRYETPFFEANAMRAAGEPASYNWRCGDLAIYVRKMGALGERPILPIAETWTERRIENSRIRVKTTDLRNIGSPVLSSVVLGDILPTVSRRDHRRLQANVWTSGNRIFNCAGTQTLLRILDVLIEQADPVKVIAQDLGRTLSQPERFRIEQTSFQLLNVVKCESDELRAHADVLRATRKLGPRSYPATALERAG